MFSSDIFSLLIFLREEYYPKETRNMDYASCITECTEKNLKASKKLVGIILPFLRQSYSSSGWLGTQYVAQEGME